VPEVRRLLAQHRGSGHRRPIPDRIIAATAELHGAEVLHLDSDYDLIAEVTGQVTGQPMLAAIPIPIPFHSGACSAGRFPGASCSVASSGATMPSGTEPRDDTSDARDVPIRNLQ